MPSMYTKLNDHFGMIEHKYHFEIWHKTADQIEIMAMYCNICNMPHQDLMFGPAHCPNIIEEAVEVDINEFDPDSFEDLIHAARKILYHTPDLQYGQALSIALNRLQPEIAKCYRTRLNPFYLTDKRAIDDFLTDLSSWYYQQVFRF